MRTVKTGQYEVFGYCKAECNKDWRWQLLCRRDDKTVAIEEAKGYILGGSLMGEKVLECRIEYPETVIRKIQVMAEINFKLVES